MAKGTATGEFVVVSQVRTGSKRELQFVLKSQSEICGGESLGRTRASKILNGDSRSTDAKRRIHPSGLKAGIKKMRLRKDEEDDNAIISDIVGCALEEDEGSKSDVVDIDEAKGLFSDSTLVEPMCEDGGQEEEKGENKKGHVICKEENGKDVEIENGHDNVAMNEDLSRELPVKNSPKVKEVEKESASAIGGDTVIGRELVVACPVKNSPKVKEVEKESASAIGGDTVIGRELVVACPADFSVSVKLASRSCHAKLDSGLGNDNPGRRLTRSMLKFDGVESEANADEVHMNPEKDAKYSEDNCVDASSSVAYGREEELHEQNSADPCLGLPSGSLQMSGNTQRIDNKAVNDAVDKPLRRLTRSFIKHESDSNNSTLENNTEPAKLGEVDVHANDVEMDDFQSPPVTTHNKRGRPKKLLRNFPANLGEVDVHANDVEMDDFQSPPVTTHNKRGRPKKYANDVEMDDFQSPPVTTHNKRGRPKKLLRNFPANLGEVDVHANDVEMDDFQSSPVTTHNKRGRPKKLLRNFPAKLKEIFDSRILEGLTVYYLRGAKMREAGTRGLKGVIKESGVLCFCSTCKGTQVVSPNLFELHAFSTNKRPPEYILLESGFTLRDVMNTCKETPLPTLEERLRVVVGPALKKSSLCFNCQGPMVEPCNTKALVLCKPCLEGKEPELHTNPSKANYALKGSAKSSVVPKTVLSRSISSPGQSNGRQRRTRKSPEPGVVPGTILSQSKSSQGKLTRKDLRLHKLVFEDDVLPDGAEVGYFVAGKKMLVGYKKGFGIHCSCCNNVVSPSLFEAHAGCATRRKPFQHIYTTNGVSLHELSVALSMDQRFSIRENDDLCSICKDGGDLLCCDTCPRSYHIVCASLPSLPSERWSCKYCVNMIEREKFVDSNLNAIAAGRVLGVDAIAQITKRCIRIVSSLGSELPSVCVLCRGHSFCRMGFNSRTVIICDQCEKEFHVGCLKEHNIADLKELPEEKWFCSLGCKKMNTSLVNLIAHGEEKLSNNFLNFIRKKQKPNEVSSPDDNTTPDIRWRVLSGKLASSDDHDTRVLLAKAVSILHERFDPISESGTRGDLIPAMVYGKKLKGHDFSGMYCTMLTVDEVVVSVGIFRIFGSELAELPLVATSKDCQGQGYFQCLFACIQRLLGFLNVKHLVLPAADEAKSIWTEKFGFDKMTEEEVKEFRRDFSVMVFHGTSMLRKTVPAPRAVSNPEDSMEQ